MDIREIKISKEKKLQIGKLQAMIESISSDSKDKSKTSLTITSMADGSKIPDWITKEKMTLIQNDDKKK